MNLFNTYITTKKAWIIGISLVVIEILTIAIYISLLATNVITWRGC